MSLVEFISRYLALIRIFLRAKFYALSWDFANRRNVVSINVKTPRT